MARGVHGADNGREISSLTAGRVSRYEIRTSLTVDVLMRANEHNIKTEKRREMTFHWKTEVTNGMMIREMSLYVCQRRMRP